MKPVPILVALISTWLSLFTPAKAVTLRYAIVIGNNSGVDHDGHEPFDRLRHAEREARIAGAREWPVDTTCNGNLSSRSAVSHPRADTISRDVAESNGSPNSTGRCVMTTL